MNKIKVEEMSCYDEVVGVLGVTQAKVELWKVVNSKCYRPLDNGVVTTELDAAFDWDSTPQGSLFWYDIDIKVLEKRNEQ